MQQKVPSQPRELRVPIFANSRISLIRYQLLKVFYHSGIQEERVIKPLL